MLNHHSLIPWGSIRGRQEEKWGSFRGRFGDHFRVGDHFGVGIISGAVQYAFWSRGGVKGKNHRSKGCSIFALKTICARTESGKNSPYGNSLQELFNPTQATLFLEILEFFET